MITQRTAKARYMLGLSRRRSLLQAIGTAGLLGLASPREQKAQEQAARATRGMPLPRSKTSA